MEGKFFLQEEIAAQNNDTTLFSLFTWLTQIVLKPITQTIGVRMNLNIMVFLSGF